MPLLAFLHFDPAIDVDLSKAITIKDASSFSNKFIASGSLSSSAGYPAQVTCCRRRACPRTCPRPWPLSTWPTGGDAEGFHGRRASHPARADLFHSLLTPLPADRALVRGPPCFQAGEWFSPRKAGRSEDHPAQVLRRRP